MKHAVSMGDSFASNVTRIRNTVPQIKDGSASFFHAKNAKQLSGVQELGDLAIKLSTTGTILRNAGYLKKHSICKTLKSFLLVFDLY